MPIPVEDLGRSVLAAIDTDAGLLRTIRWTSERYRELCNRAKFRHLRRIGEVNIPAPVTTGLATVTRDSNVVTGDVNASPTWDSTLIGRHFRAQVVWYEIVNVIPSATAAQLILRSKYSEAPAASQPTGFRIVQRYVPLDPMVRWVGDFVLMRRRRRLRPMSLKELDMIYPARNNITNGPRVVSEIGITADGFGATPDIPSQNSRKTMEFYPYSDLSEMVRYAYWPISRDLQVGDFLPDEVDLVLLKKGVMIDLFRYEMGRAARLGQQPKSEMYRNESRAQTTEWERGILDAVRADKAMGQDDMTFILRSGGYLPSDEPLITTARDEVFWARWPL